MANKNVRKKRTHGEGHIAQRPDGTWTARIQDGFNAEGKPKIKAFYGKTRKEAAEKLDDFKAFTRLGGEDSDLCIVGLNDKEGLATYLIVNSGVTAKQFTINTPVTKRAFFDVFVFDKIKAASKSDNLTGSSQRIPCSRNVMVADIGPESCIVLREAGLEPID